MPKMYNLTHETLTEVLDFDPATGVFTWKIARSNRVKSGSRAGVVHKPSGGRYIAIDKEKFMAHRLAFFYVNKRWPNTDVRPIDANYDNCAVDNLKEVSRVDLQHSRSKVATNTSGFVGVSKSGSKWQAKITWNYHQIALGANFDTAEEAGAVYQLAFDALKTASSDEDIKSVVAKFRLEKRQRAVWNNMLAYNSAYEWPSFEAFALDVQDIPDVRYAIAPVDAAKPIGPQNYQWASAGFTVSSSKDRRGYNKARRAANRDQHRGRDFQKKYGIDFAEYQRLLIEQKGVCGVCEQPETKIQHGAIRMLSVDHNHKTGAVRGLLCGNCNLAIGYACDDPTILHKAIGYLRKHDPDNVVKFEPSIVGGVMGNGA